MVFVSEAYTTVPATFSTALQEKVYQVLQELTMDFQRVETEEVITMEDCQQINERLDMDMVKTLFLCNRQKTNFYLFVTCGDKPFKSKEFSQALDIARVSFASAEQMDSMLGTKLVRRRSSAPCCQKLQKFSLSWIRMFAIRNIMAAVMERPQAI